MPPMFSSTSSDPKKPVIRKVTTIRKVSRPASSPAQASRSNTASRISSSSKPAPSSKPPTDRYKLTPRTTDKSRPAQVRSGQKRKSSSPSVAAFGSDSEGDSDGLAVEASAPKRARADSTSLPTISRRLRDTTDRDSEYGSSFAMIHGADLCAKEHSKEFTPAFDVPAKEPIEVQLQYPGSLQRERFLLVRPKKSDGYRPLDDIGQTISQILEQYLPSSISAPLLDQSTGLEWRLNRALKQNKAEDFTAVIDEYNELIEKHRKSGTICKHLDTKTSMPRPHLNHIINQIYERTVSPRVELLSRYESMSSNTYGELLPPFASQIFRDASLGPDSVFLDLGSGVGNVALQAALDVGCRSYGIEMMGNPVALATAQAAEFVPRARLWGIAVGPVELWQGDFLDDSKVSELLRTADVVLVNNQAFTPSLNNALKDRLLDLKEGARLVSLKSFVPGGWQLTPRTQSDPIAGLEVRHCEFWSKWVSWKEEGGDYYVATKDSSRIERILGQGRRRAR